MLLLQWADWDAQHADEAPQELQLAEFYAANMKAHVALARPGPCLQVTGVPAWGAVLAAHAKANDDHVQLYGAC